MTKYLKGPNGVNAVQVSPHLAILTFRLGGQGYGLPVTEVAQIIEMVMLTHLPQAPFAIQGIINLHGKIVPVMDLRLRFGLPLKPYQLHTPIILTLLKEHTLGLIVDWVEDVVEIPAADLKTGEAIFPSPLVSPSPGPEPIAYWAGVAKVERRLIPILKVEAILSLEEQTRLAKQVTLNQGQARNVNKRALVNESSF
jgi:purine-binding chemotaxis protein CheW